jgi:hypothetical protein
MGKATTLSAVDGQSAPSIGKVTNSKFEIQNSKQFQTGFRVFGVSVRGTAFDIRIADFVSAGVLAE